MSESVNRFIHELDRQAHSLKFNEVLSMIDRHYDFFETAFENGSLHNAAGSNNGSCKVFSFALLNNLSEQQTLLMFAQYYREDVMLNPSGDNHQNIRQFMQHGFSGLNFHGVALKPK